MKHTVNWASLLINTFNYGSSQKNLLVKVQQSVDAPKIGQSVRDGTLTCNTLVGKTGKVVGYSFVTGRMPINAMFFAYNDADWRNQVDEEEIKKVYHSVCWSFCDGEPDCNESTVVLGTQHLRAIRVGDTKRPVYHIVLRKPDASRQAT